MLDHLQKQVSVVVVDEESARSNLVFRALSADARFSVRPPYALLNEAFVSVENQPPDIVVFSEGMALREEFPMFGALLDLVSSKRVFVGPNPTSGAYFKVKSDQDVVELMEGLCAQLAIAAAPSPAMPDKKLSSLAPSDKALVVIGSSTGGIEALMTLLGGYPEACPATLIVQHIKPDFLSGMVSRLNANSRAHVSEARDGDRAEPGKVLVAPGENAHLVLSPKGRKCRLQVADRVSGHRPSVDMLFSSAAAYGSDVVAALLTGMGRDGAAGMLKIRKAGGWTIGQDEATSVVYGMPQAARRLGAVREELPLQKISGAILGAAANTRKATAK